MSDALDALYCLDPGMPRETWVRIAFAARDAGITEAEFIAWSEGAANFDRTDAVTTYRNAKPRAGGVTSATLFMMARDAGYKPEGRAGGNGRDAAPARAPPPRAAPTPEPIPTDPMPVWEACDAVDVHGYLSRKSIKAHGARVSGSGWLVVPYYNRERQLQTLQHIAADGSKRFLSGARQKGSVAILGEVNADAALVAVAEGFATAAAIEESTGVPTLASGSRVTLPEAAKIARYFAPNARVVIAADRGDLSTPLAAARAVGGFLAVPGPEDSAEGFDFNDWRLKGATDAEIRARIDHASPVPVGDDQAARTDSVPKVAKTGTLATKAARTLPTGPTGAFLTDDKGRVVPNLANVFAYLKGENLGVIRRDIFTGILTWSGAPMEESSYSTVTRAMQGAVIDGRMPFAKINTPLVVEAVNEVGDMNGYNSCVEWLDSIGKWDGVERIPRFFSDTCDVEATDYMQGASRYFWYGLVGRMVKPGMQVDASITLVGPQGIGKSRLARLIGGERYGEVGLAHIGERDWCAQLRGKIVMEFGELSGHSRAELETVKAVITRSHDEYRLPYARTATLVPRGCVFLATTNEPDFLIDASGNRRWLPVQCKAPFALEAVRAMREQLFAEAYALVRSGLPPDWWRVSDALDVQAEHLAPDPWIDLLDEKLRSLEGELPDRVENTRAYAVLAIPADRQTGGGTGRRLSAAMRALGYVGARLRVSNRTVRGFFRTQEEE